MVFTSPEWVPQLSIDPPDSISLHDFMATENFGRLPFSQSRNPFTCGLTGKTYSASEAGQRADFLARAIARKLDFSPNEGVEWDKVVAIFSLNAIDTFSVTQAVHRLSGIVTPASAAYSASELEHQLRSSGAKALFTCTALVDRAVKAAEAVGISKDHIFLLETPGGSKGVKLTTVDELIQQGVALPALESLKWVKGQGARQVAYLCYSSGTSGLPKAVMISHRNVISNVLQISAFDSVSRQKLGIKTQACLGVLPFSHIYGLLIISYASTFRGDGVIVMPEFDFKAVLAAVQKYKIALLFVVPPIIIRIIRNETLCAKYDLSSVRYVYTGAAPLGSEVVDEVRRQYPKWRVGQGYGLTETCTVVCTTSELDVDDGSSGSLVPGTRAMLVDIETGQEITEYNKPGELLVQSPSLALGYLNNQKATTETFIWRADGRWIRTGDEVLVRKAASGNEHLVIVDRLKELIKVNGHQVAPAELEAHLLGHDLVSDCAVIQVSDNRTGEVPKAYVVKSEKCDGLSDENIVGAICQHVETHKAKHKWLRGGVEFIDTIPKSPSGKILRRQLRDKEREAKKQSQAKL
ncbi:hypothetical protein NW759_007219 [Fusarium solani]|uniref:Phenylacetyl-CoA ligase n=1 Tax=Fusarium solani TaxID=169388 RepID=A0A9P9HAU0_FUSSL|nr:uncharacterized protein B0J15DRAFT_425313 [Fusarium solani]KAH7253448.1 hypothetical protein B0J15DRAFT_425313 [Fusarium solani]KAJ4221152.1 hypothetical protein NW759_007219 [Fusarium solani]